MPSVCPPVRARWGREGCLAFSLQLVPHPQHLLDKQGGWWAFNVKENKVTLMKPPWAVVFTQPWLSFLFHPLHALSIWNTANYWELFFIFMFLFLQRFDVSSAEDHLRRIWYFTGRKPSILDQMIIITAAQRSPFHSRTRISCRLQSTPNLWCTPQPHGTLHRVGNNRFWWLSSAQHC